MRKKNKNTNEGPLLPMELPERTETTPEPRVKPLINPIWTENKAKLIERYLYYFVLVTHHGTYIDGFAGPQFTILSTAVTAIGWYPFRAFP